MTEPPKEVEGRTPHHQGQPSTNNTNGSHHTTNTGQRNLVGRQRRRATAVRLQGGDPDNPGTRYHRPSTGLRASGYREGYGAALRWFQREFYEHLDELGRARLATVMARSEAA